PASRAQRSPRRARRAPAAQARRLKNACRQRYERGRVAQVSRMKRHKLVTLSSESRHAETVTAAPRERADDRPMTWPELRHSPNALDGDADEYARWFAGVEDQLLEAEERYRALV